MINKITLRELKKCVRANVGEVNENTKEIFIPKLTIIELQPNKEYIIELKDSVLHPTTSSTLASNWNQGRVPTSKYYKATVLVIMASMVRISGIPYDVTNNAVLDSNEWIGWLPIPELKILKEI